MPSGLHTHTRHCPVPGCFQGRSRLPAHTQLTPSLPEMLSESEDDLVSSNTNSYDYGEAWPAEAGGIGNLTSGPRSEVWSAGLVLFPQAWEDWGGEREVPQLSLLRPPLTGDEYRPLLSQETTAEILARALNPLDSRKWRSKSASWRALKVLKVGRGVCVCVHARVWVPVYLCVYLCVSLCLHACPYGCAQACLCTCVFTCVCVCVTGSLTAWPGALSSAQRKGSAQGQGGRNQLVGLQIQSW